MCLDVELSLDSWRLMWYLRIVINDIFKKLKMISIFGRKDVFLGEFVEVRMFVLKEFFVGLVIF